MKRRSGKIAYWVALERMAKRKPEINWSSVLCLEGSWDAESLEDRTSVLPTLELLERLDQIKFVHRDVATRSEFEHYLDRWLNEGLPYYVLYLASHGSEGNLSISESSDADLSLGYIADRLSGCLDGCVVYLGSCSVMDAPKRKLDSFLEETGARALIGYTKDIDWIEAAAMDLLVLGAVSYHAQLGRAINLLEDRRYASLRRALGLKIVRR